MPGLTARKNLLRTRGGHDDGRVKAALGIAAIGGPAVFLAGNLLFKLVIAGRPPLSHMVGLVGLAALAVTTGSLSPLALLIGTTLILIVVAMWETISLGGAGEPPTPELDAD